MARGGKRANSGRKITISESDLDSLSDSTLKNFLDGIKSKHTSNRYTRILHDQLMNVFDEFLKGSFENRCNQICDLAIKDNKKVNQLIRTHVRKLKERTELNPKDDNYLNPSSVSNLIKPIKKLFAMNDVPFSWKGVNSMLPDVAKVSFTKTRGYTKEEIRKMLPHCIGSIERGILLTLSSSGMRIGTLPGLTWEDITPIYKIDDQYKPIDEILESEFPRAQLACAVVVIYKGSSSEGFAFITPEAYEALQEWKIDYKVDIGHTPKESDVVFKKQGYFARPTNEASISKRINNMVRKSGIFSGKLPDGVRRREIPKTNGFRYFFNQVVKNTASQDSKLATLIKTEFMMNHTGLAQHDRNYFKVNLMELVSDYVKSIPELTISKEMEAQQEIISKQKKIEDLERSNNETIQELNERISKLENIVLKDRFNNL